MPHGGKLILIEGLDRCGKDTEINALMKKVQCVRFNFPNEEIQSGKTLRRYLNGEIELSDREVNDLFAQNRKETLPAIEEYLDRGVHVLLSRYAFSGVAYTSAKGTLSLDEATIPDKGILIPSITFLLYEDPQLIEHRFASNDRYERVDFERKVLEQYFELEKLPGIGKWEMVDCTNKSIEAIHDEIWGKLRGILESDEKVSSGLFEESRAINSADTKSDGL